MKWKVKPMELAVALGLLNHNNLEEDNMYTPKFWFECADLCAAIGDWAGQYWYTTLALDAGDNMEDQEAFERENAMNDLWESQSYCLTDDGE